MQARLLAASAEPEDGADEADGFWAMERRYLLPFWIPHAAYALSYGAGLVALPLFLLRTLKVPYAYMGGYKVAQELAELAANNPSAWVVGRFGWKGGLASGGGGFLLGSVLLSATSFWDPERHPQRVGYLLFLGAYLLQSGAMKFFNRGGAILTSELRSHQRGRHSNLQAGLRYLTTAVGPWLAGLLMSTRFGARGVFTAMIGIGVVALGSMFLAFRSAAAPEEAPQSAGLSQRGQKGGGQQKSVAGDAGYGHFWRDAETRAEWLLASTACLIIVLLRGCFNMMVPIQGTFLGLDTAAIALTFVCCNLCGFSLFWVGGMILDTLGRRWSAVPACALFAAAFVLLGSASGARGMHFAAIFFGFGETISGGIKRSLKADFTDRAYRHRLTQTQQKGGEGDVEGARLHRARFSAMIDNTLDSVGIVYPIALASVAQAFTPLAACLGCAALGVAGVVVFSFVVTETLQRRDGRGEGLAGFRLKAFLMTSLAVFAGLFVYLVSHAAALL